MSSRKKLKFPLGSLTKRKRITYGASYPARKYLFDKCGIADLVFYSLDQIKCARAALTVSDQPSREHRELVAAVESFTYENSRLMEMNYEAADSALQNYLHEYNAISILRGACKKTIQEGEDIDEKCGSHDLNFLWVDIPYFPTQEVSSDPLTTSDGDEAGTESGGGHEGIQQPGRISKCGGGDDNSLRLLWNTS